MRKISGSTIYFRVMFPTVWFGFMTFLAVSSLWNRNIAELLIPLAGGVFGFFLFKKIAWDLVDVVYDGGDYLVFRKRDLEQRVELADIVNINYSAGSPPRVTVTSRSMGPLGRELTFVPAADGNSFFGSTPAIVSELIERVERSRR